METIRVFTVGGTIDKIYFDANSSYEVGPPNIARILVDLQLNPQFEVTSLMQKDSLDMTDSDRALIRAQVSSAAETRILITHGTDTMVETAKALMAGAVNQGKTVVLTGALSPALFKNSDAMFNIGGAVIAVQTLPPGCYIAMNGQVFTADKVRKDSAANRFVAYQTDTNSQM
ncbi:MAG: asparaginase domain-containing protein [Pseudohongiellaceae bacterium]